jgi:hypothetical protein
MISGNGVHRPEEIPDDGESGMMAYPPGHHADPLQRKTIRSGQLAKKVTKA